MAFMIIQLTEKPMPPKATAKLIKAALGAALVLVAAPALTQSANPPQALTGLRYESIFDTYRPYLDAPLKSWRETNDDVGKIGGWRSYAKQMAADEASPDQPAASDPHAGHHKAVQP